MDIGYSFGQMIWIVLVYSFLGWCCEVAFAAVRRGIFVNRGFLNGPVCPIYGFGVLIVLLVLEPVKDNLALLFFGSMVLTSALEFFIGFIMEQFFHDKWWDYSENPFNIKGYICLEFSLVWGAACVLVVDVIHPMIFKLICAIPEKLSLWLMVFFTAKRSMRAWSTARSAAKPSMRSTPSLPSAARKPLRTCLKSAVR